MGMNMHRGRGRKNILSSIFIIEVMPVSESEEDFHISVGNLSEEGQVEVNAYGSLIRIERDIVRGGRSTSRYG